MNKKTVLLTFVLLLSNTVNCFASRDGWNTVLNRLSDSMYGGAYVKEDVLHIKPIDTKQVQDIIADVAPNADIVLDPPAKYTMAQLIDGQNKADKIWDELKLDYVAISEQNNGLSAGSTSVWTEQNKTLFIKTTGIENVTFETTPHSQTEQNIVQQRYIQILPYSFYIATLQKDGTLSLKQTIRIYGSTPLDDTAYGGEEDIDITFEHMPYVKNDYIMIPLREAVGREIAYRELIKNNYSDISEETMKELIQNDYSQIAQYDYSNCTEKVLLRKDTELNNITISFEGNNITFHEGSRDFYINGVNGIKRGLYMPPDITDDEIYLCDKDFNTLFKSSSQYLENGEKQLLWYFRSVMGFPLEIEDKLFINVLTTAKNEETFRVSTQYGGTVFYRNDYSDKENEKSIAVYEKNGHMMIALQYIPRFRGTTEFLETTWDNKTSTTTLKFWGETAKDVVFQKGSSNVIINGVEVAMEEAAEIKDGRMYIPINTLFEILEIPEQNIEWLEPGKNVKVTYGRYRRWAHT